MTYAEFGERLAGSGALPADFPARDAEWLAKVALHGGLFLRSQYEAGLGVDRSAAHRVVERLVAANLGREVDGGAGFGRYFHVTARAVYRAVGMGDSRLRRAAARGAMLQRLLALDCVIAHPELPWVPGREGAVESLVERGVPERHLPQRAYAGSGDAPAKVVYLPARWPLALGDGGAVWAFPDSGQSGNPRLDLRTWGSQHATAWRALRRGGCEPSALFVTRSERRAAQARTEFRTWAEKGLACPGGGDGVAEAAAEIERIKRGLEADPRAVYERYGGLRPTLDRLSALEKDIAAGSGGRFRMERSSAWISERLQLRSALVGGPEPDISFEVRRL